MQHPARRCASIAPLLLPERGNFTQISQRKAAFSGGPKGEVRMGSIVSRREFLAGLGGVAAAAVSSLPREMFAAPKPPRRSSRMKSPFHISVINDEISQDFGRA